MSGTTSCQFVFGCRHEVFSTALLQALDEVKADCEAAFTAKEMARDDAYSSGSTFFIKCSETPSCLLEQMALSLFSLHKESGRLPCDNEIDAATSGVEWWTQAIDSRDDIGWHWDRDYQLEEDEGVHRYPVLATVTYLTTQPSGGSTIVLHCRGSTGSDDALPAPTVPSYVVSRPRIGKHLWFGGSMLHAALSDLRNQQEEEEEEEEVEGGGESEDDEDDDVPGLTRVTFLANIWLNHVPKYASRLPRELASSMLARPSSQSPVKISHEGGSNDVEPKQLELQSEHLSKIATWNFQDSSRKYKLTLPLPGLLDDEEDRSLLHVLYADGLGQVEHVQGADVEEDEEEEEPKKRRRRG